MEILYNTAARTPFVHSRSKQVQYILALVISAVVAGLIGFGSIDGSPPEMDDINNMMYGYNLAQHGIFSRAVSDDPAAVTPDFYREPVYPAMIAAALMFFADMDGMDASCFRHDDDCADARLTAKRINIVLYIALAWMMIFTVRVFSRRWLAVYVALALLLIPNYFYLQRSLTEMPAALFFLMHSTFMYLAITVFRQGNRKGAYAYAVTSGVSLGVLILTRSIFLYWLPLLAVGLFVFWLLWGHGQRRPLVAVFAALVIPPLILSNGWIAANYDHLQGFQISTGRDEGVLELRAEFTRLTPQEYMAAFAFFSPAIVQPLLLALIDEDYYLRLDRERPVSFYQQRRAGEGIVRELAEELATDVSTATVITLREHLITHISLIPVFAYRGAFVRGWPHAFDFAPLDSVAFRALSLVVTSAAMVPLQLAIPAILTMSFLALRRRDDALLLFFLPALYSYGIYAAFTHYIPRYSVPLIPVFIIALLLATRELRIGWRTRRKPVQAASSRSSDLSAV